MENNTLIQVIKIIVLFIICTTVFYICLRVLQLEYEHNQRYDLPEGPSVKVHRVNQ